MAGSKKSAIQRHAKFSGIVPFNVFAHDPMILGERRFEIPLWAGAALVTCFLVAAAFVPWLYLTVQIVYVASVLSAIMLATLLRAEAWQVVSNNPAAIAAFVAILVSMIVHSELIYPNVRNARMAPVFAAYVIFLFAVGIVVRWRPLLFARIAVAVFAIAAVGAVARYLPEAIETNWVLRLSPLGLFRGAIIGAGAYLLVFIVAIGTFKAETDRLGRAFLLVATLPLLAMILLTQSRSLYLAGALATGVYVLGSVERRDVLRSITFLGAALLVFLVAITLSDTLREIAQSLIERDVWTRVRAWTIALQGIASQPLFGSPLDSFDQQERLLGHPHNILLSLTYYYGIVPGIAYLVILLSIFRNWWRSPTRDALPLALLVAFLFVFSLDGGNALRTSAPPWLIVWPVLVLSLILTSPGPKTSAFERGSPPLDQASIAAVTTAPDDGAANN